MGNRGPSNKACRRPAELVGGPFDGQVIRVTETPPFISLPVNENMYLALEGKPRGAPLPAMSIAVYERSEREGKLYYYFVRSYSSREARLEGWRG
jgi:hypothetical protein